MLDTLQTLLAGLHAHRSGDLSAAEANYRDVLAAEPGHARATYYLGLALLAGGHARASVAHFRAAVLALPADSAVRVGLADAQLASGEIGAAISTYEDVLARVPTHLAARVNLANAWLQIGDHSASLDLLRPVLAERPALFEANMTSGAAHLAAGDPDRAVAAYQAALASRPSDPGAKAGLAGSLLQRGSGEAALAMAETTLRERPDFTEAALARGSALAFLMRLDEAIEVFRDIIRREPRNARAHLNLGNALLDADRHDEAEYHLRRALECDPRLPEAHASLGFLLAGAGHFADAIAACGRAIELRPGFAQAHWNQGVAYLLSGDLERGWGKYEWRKRHDRFARDFVELPGPRWLGEDLGSRTILVQAEQGLGDTIQFARYLPALAARGARVLVACAPELIPLLSTADGVARCVARGGGMPEYDCWVDQLSLPGLFGTILETIHTPRGYLHADPHRAAAWRRELPSGFRIGFVWAGNPAHSNDRRRSMPIETLTPILSRAEFACVSLQAGPRANEGDGLGFAATVGSRLTDYAETAAAIECLDLVVTVDTSVAHLAGAMGKPVWVMLPFAPDWRWLAGRDDSPWYASMRLFRQTTPGDWPGVVDRVAAALTEMRAAVP